MSCSPRRGPSRFSRTAVALRSVEKRARKTVSFVGSARVLSAPPRCGCPRRSPYASWAGHLSRRICPDQAKQIVADIDDWSTNHRPTAHGSRPIKKNLPLVSGARCLVSPLASDRRLGGRRSWLTHSSLAAVLYYGYPGYLRSSRISVLALSSSRDFATLTTRSALRCRGEDRVYHHGRPERSVTQRRSITSCPRCNCVPRRRVAANNLSPPGQAP